jgi:hypothetical protein
MGADRLIGFLTGLGVRERGMVGENRKAQMSLESCQRGLEQRDLASDREWKGRNQRYSWRREKE